MWILKTLLKKALATVLGRWVTGGVVALLLGGAAWWWYDFKSDLREEGANECVQLVNEETHKQLVEANYRKQQQIMELQREMREVKIENALAKERQRRAEENLMVFRNATRTQEQNDENYREWSSTPLPDGVADRLRELQPTDN
jgi:hypothetical protein